MNRVWLVLLLSGCRSQSAAPAPSRPMSATSNAAPSASLSAPVDFENQFAYGEIDAGGGDATRLVTRPGYDAYANGRFGFTLDVPKAFDAMPDPENGDGRQWRIGSVAAMTASGMHAVPELEMTCAQTSAVTAMKKTPSSCWRTGKANGFIYWERTVLAHGKQYSLRFQYVESMKSAMDPVITHVNASWQF